MSVSATTPLIAVAGPTACGKTHRAVALARHFGGEIISADSRQVYRGMDIGTGKDLDEYGDIPYHMIDVAEPGEQYNLHRYLKGARQAIDDIRSRGRQPIVCGGSGMYIESLLKGTVLPDVPVNTALRSRLEGKTLDELTTILASYRELHNITDSDTAQRTIRAIEIEQYYVEHPDQYRDVSTPVPPDAITVLMDVPRDRRRSLIEQRMRYRFDHQDMLAEVEGLLENGVKAEALIGYGLEYKFITQHILGMLSRAEMERLLLIAIQQFAKRQGTWFRGMEQRMSGILDAIHFDSQGSDEELIAAVEQRMHERQHTPQQ